MYLGLLHQRLLSTLQKKKVKLLIESQNNLLNLIFKVRKFHNNIIKSIILTLADIVLQKEKMEAKTYTKNHSFSIKKVLIMDHYMIILKNNINTTTKQVIFNKQYRCLVHNTEVVKKLVKTYNCLRLLMI